MDSNDLSLIQRWISSRDAGAFHEIVLRYSALVYGACWRVLGNHADAEVEVPVLAIAKTRARFITESRKDGKRLEVTRKLAPDAKATFDFLGDKASLAAWSEAYSGRVPSGLPTRIERTVAMDVEDEGGERHFETSLLLEAKRAV